MPECRDTANDHLSGSGPARVLSGDSKYVWYVVLLLSTVNIFNYADRTALAVLVPLIKRDLALSDGEIGLLVGVAFSVFYAVCGLPIARWGDRGTRRNIIALALTAWSVMTALSGTAQNFWHLFATRVGVGAGEAGCAPSSQSMICDYVPLTRRSGVFAIHNFGTYGGMMFGMAAAGPLGQALGWRWAFVLLGLPGVVLAAIVIRTLREPVRGSFDARNDTHRDLSLRQTVGVLWRCRTYRLLLLFLVSNGFVQYGLNQWWPSFYVRQYGLSLSSVGVYVGIAIGVGSAIGSLLGGALANYTIRRDVGLPLKIGAGATCMAVPTAAASLFASSVHVSIVMVALTGFFWSVSNGPVLASIYSVVMPRMRATTASVNIFFTSLFGFGLGPLCVGILSDAFAPTWGAQALRYALLAPICMLPVVVAALRTAATELPNGLRAVGALQ